MLAVQEVLHWSDEEVALLFRSALTMNIGTTNLQDRLALQNTPLDYQQREAIGWHNLHSTERLESLGVQDAFWLESVRSHHEHIAQPLHGSHTAQRFAGLIQRADVFAARLAPRASRAPSSTAMAMRSIYFDTDSHVDEAGDARIKAVGYYQPGSFVKLRTGEVAVVLQRGMHTALPKVAVILNRHAVATVEPIIRDTATPAYAIASQVPWGDVRVHLSLDKMLDLTRTS